MGTPIKNLIAETQKNPFKQKPKVNKKNNDNEEDDVNTEDDGKPKPMIKTATDLQRLKLEKLMKNPDKPIVIPESRREKDHLQSVPSFVRNVMGSSAGAGSGEFHVYRHLRRKEYARQKQIQMKSYKEQLDDEYQQKLEDNRRAADEKTAKKRAKRQKKKERAKRMRKEKGKNPGKNEKKSSSEDEDESENDDDEDNVAEETIDATDTKIDEEFIAENIIVGPSNKDNKTATSNSNVDEVETKAAKDETEKLNEELIEKKTEENITSTDDANLNENNDSNSNVDDV